MSEQRAGNPAVHTACGCCWQSPGDNPELRFGTLLDPNGHTWALCSECINTIWHERQPMAKDQREPTPYEEVEQLIEQMSVFADRIEQLIKAGKE